MDGVTSRTAGWDGVPRRGMREIRESDIQGAAGIIGEIRGAMAGGNFLEHVEEVLDPAMAIFQHLQGFGEIGQGAGSKLNGNHRDGSFGWRSIRVIHVIVGLAPGGG